ncbi:MULTISPECIES: gluconate 2-dehydrogenase subunit 3 family protein [Niastella]|uniref:Gluconate 2-dehydrogenase subunit 3 family protein n=1 Tax=Niastella soli TaxID=2821487 RepID=A0ABS3YWD1_9BACT|nr:gluconate 2-dehydrogenase subunit 3 family protein [Niastella soli]MBO9202134.1 gluconate 2-dehydrogenase subunit 3 family protein [Niastella soli]
MAAPFAVPIALNDEQILNYCAKHLSRGPKLFVDDVSPDSFNLTTVAEGWRFPIVLAARDSEGFTGRINEVSFVWVAKPNEVIDSIQVTGSFLPMYQSLALAPVLYDGENIGIYGATIQAPVGKGYYYRFRVNGRDVPDPINPQRKTLPNGSEWSFFFTDYYNSSEEFEDWEISILYRLANCIVPFRTPEAQNFINRFYLTLAKPNRLSMPIYKLDESVGEVNYITNILAREERHHLQDYKICLKLIDQVLRQRNPFVDSWLVSQELILELYEQMASGTVPGWDYSLYNNPTYFLALLRRHTITGAFSHPRYGGNIGGVGWGYLKERYAINNNVSMPVDSYFNWQLALEKPLGSNEEYLG